MADEELNDAQTDKSDAPQDVASEDVQEIAGDDKDGDKTLLTEPGDSAASAPADWPDDWRVKLAGDDEKALKKLDRYKSPQDIFKAYRALEAKMSSGDVVAKLPKDATEEQIAEYRKANGIPEKADGYLDALPDGLVVGDDDKPLVKSFLEKVHGKNAPPEVVADAVAWYYETQEQLAAETAAADKERRAAAADELRAEWGREYTANINSIKAFLDTAPIGEDGTSLRDMLMGARLANGVPLGDSPEALRWLAKLADDANPGGFIAPGAGSGNAETIESQIKEIEAKMGTKEYIKDEAMQAKLRKLYAARESIKTRAA